MNPFVTTKPAGVGTGLGLSIGFEIVKKHGGTMSIASEHGLWTEVTVNLPCAVDRLAVAG
jgi:signal transduction histidine kinase